MKWSQLKARVESNFAEAVKGRVEVFETRYRHAQDGEGEGWITLDKVKIYTFSSCRFMADESLSGRQRSHEDGVFPLWELNSSLFSYLNLSMAEVMTSENPILQGFGMLDRRFGKRRLEAFHDTVTNPLVKLLYTVRRRLEDEVQSCESSRQNGQKGF